MNQVQYPYAFWPILIVLLFFVIFFDREYYMLRDNSQALPRPYSFARVQLAWWSVIVLSCLAAAIVSEKWQIPDFKPSILYLLGISSATTIGATLIDINDQTNPNLTGLAQNMKGDNFFLDILSDKNGINVHRFQTVVFNLIFGVWFIREFLSNVLDGKAVNDVLPDFTTNQLILLGVSSGVYAALKTTENKQPTLPDANSASDPRPQRAINKY